MIRDERGKLVGSRTWWTLLPQEKAGMETKDDQVEGKVSNRKKSNLYRRKRSKTRLRLKKSQMTLLRIGNVLNVVGQGVVKPQI